MLNFKPVEKPTVRGVSDVTCSDGLVISMNGERKLLFRMPGDSRKGLCINDEGLSFAPLPYYEENARVLGNISLKEVQMEVHYEEA